MEVVESVGVRQFSFNRGGFSLVEILVVMAVIGAVTAVAVPTIGRMNDAAAVAKDQRNAQALASVCASAKVAGKDFVADADFPTSQHWVIHALRAGDTISQAGPFQGNFFGVPNISEEDIYGSQAYLEVVDGALLYNPAGDSVDPVDPAP